MQPEFFVDRSLGRLRVPALLRAAGWVVTTHHEVYGDRDEEVPDVEWLELCADRGLAVLSKDRRLRYRPAEVAVIHRRRLHAFVLSRGNFTAEEQAARFIGNALRIERELTHAGLAVFVVRADDIHRTYP